MKGGSGALGPLRWLLIAVVFDVEADLWTQGEKKDCLKEMRFVSFKKIGAPTN